MVRLSRASVEINLNYSGYPPRQILAGFFFCRLYTAASDRPLFRVLAFKLDRIRIHTHVYIRKGGKNDDDDDDCIPRDTPFITWKLNKHAHGLMCTRIVFRRPQLRIVFIDV